MAEKEPIELLEEVHEAVVQSEQSQTDEQQMPTELRFTPNRETKQVEILRFVAENAPINSGEITDAIDGSVTTVLSDLYLQYLVNRTTYRNSYRYTVSELGKKALEEVDVQVEIDDAIESFTNPWDDTELVRSQYDALKVVVESDGRLTSTELNERYEEMGYDSPINPRLTELYDGLEHQYVGRTPRKPYLYWPTEKGLEVIDGDEVDDGPNPYNQGRRKHQVYDIVAEHPSEWVTSATVGERLDTTELQSTGEDLASTYLSDMVGETLERRKNGMNIYEYRISDD